MDKISELIPILIIIAAFIIKAFAESNKKQQGQKKNYPRPVQTKRETYNQVPRRSPSNYGDTTFSYDQEPSFDDLNSKTTDNDYRSLDPKYVPRDVPNIDYDKMSNVSVKDSSNEVNSPIIFIQRTEFKNEKLISIKKKLKEMDTVRDLYLFSEILNKPKAFRKWQRSTR